MENDNFALLIDVLIPGFDDKPSGSQAGVLDFLHRYDRANWTAYRLLLDAVQQASKATNNREFADLSISERIAVMSQVASASPDLFAIFRNDSYKGYFAHPKWRNGKGMEIWSKLGFQPVLSSTDNFYSIHSVSAHSRAGAGKVDRPQAD